MATHLPAQPPRPYDIEFESDPVPRRFTYQRQWPRILGRWAYLDDLIWSLEALADRAGIRRYWRRDLGVGQAVQYMQGDDSIAFARETRDHRPLYGWLLAHELGHALDPRFDAFGAVEYGAPGEGVATRTYDLIAEASALCCFWSFGLHVEAYEPHLVSVGGTRWNRRLGRAAYSERLWAAAGVMCKPMRVRTQDHYKIARAHVRSIRRSKREARARIRRECRSYGYSLPPKRIDMRPADPPRPPTAPESSPAAPEPSPASTGSDVESELAELLASVKSDEDARQRFVELLEMLGPDDARTAAWRKRLSAALY